MNPYADIDFAGVWQQLQALRPPASTSEFWDGRAESFDHKKPSPYTGSFIAALGLRSGESVFDMGCGTGTLGIELARAGHHAICADFSPRMLEVLNEKASKLEHELGHALPIETKLLSWSDDWADAGVLPKSVDVAYASRSMAVEDLGEAIDKMTSTARRRCAATITTNGSPRCCDAILEAAGRPAFSRYDAAFFVDILWQKGFTPELSYINYGKERTYPDIPALVADAKDRLHDATSEEVDRLEAYAQAHAHQTADGTWTIEEFNIVKWAFIAWNVS